MRNVLDKTGEKIKTQLMFNRFLFENCAFSEIMWKKY
jgi:hypothetical protein